MHAPPWRVRWPDVTAAAGRAGSQQGVTASRSIFVFALVAASSALLPATATAGQIGAVVSVFSDDRFRGVSISNGQPVGTLDLSYDATNGLYGDLSGTIVATPDEGIKALSAFFNGGYARQLRPGLAADFGVSHARYSHYSSFPSGRAFTEAYVGLAARDFGGRISISPDYFGVPRWTAHGQLDAHVDLSRTSTLEGEAGLLLPLAHSADGGSVHPQFDARIGFAQRAGPVTFHAALSGGSGRNAIYGGHGNHRVVLVLGLSAAL